MDVPLEDVLRLWASDRPEPLDDDLFDSLLLLIHRLLAEVARTERAAAARRLLRPSRC